MKYRDLARYYLKQRIKYEITDNLAPSVAMFGAMSDTVTFLQENSKCKDRAKATDFVWDYIINNWSDVLNSNKITEK